MEVREFRKFPFCWQDKPTLRYINDNVERKQLSSIRNIYFTLTELASDYSSEDIKVFIFDVANRSWLNEKTVSKCLKILEDLWIITFWKQQKNSDWKYWKKEIRLVSANFTARNFGESSEKVWYAKLPIYIEDNIENNIENNNIIISSNEDIITKKQTNITSQQKKENNNKENPADLTTDAQKIFNYWNSRKQIDKHWHSCRNFDETIKQLLIKILKKYSKEDIEAWLKNYQKEIKTRKDNWSWYAQHRFTLLKFFTQRNGFLDYYNKD